MNPKFALITALAGKTRDRFAEYQESRSINEKIELISKINGVSGIEIIFPDETPEPEKLLKITNDYGLKIAAINCNIKGKPCFSLGAISSPEVKVRKEAIGLLKNAKDYASQVGANKVHSAPLNDGYDYFFQTNYMDAWKYMVDSLSEVCEYVPEINLVIEYKESEPRVRCFFSNFFSVLSICRQLGYKNLGATIDIGHSFYNGENPSEALCNFVVSGFPYYVHINDNNRRWDWDLIPGTWNTMNLLEFLFWLDEFKYDDFLTFDVFPGRLDVNKTFESAIRITAKFCETVEKLDKALIKKLMSENDFLSINKYIEQILYK